MQDCQYGQAFSNEKGHYMLCPKDCGCTTKQLKREQNIESEPTLLSILVPLIIGFLICAAIYGFYLIVDAVSISKGLF